MFCGLPTELFCESLLLFLLHLSPIKILEAKDLKQDITELNFWFVRDAVLCSIHNMLSEPNFLKPDYAHVMSNVKSCQLYTL